MIEVSITTRQMSKRLATAKETGEHLLKGNKVLIAELDVEQVKNFIHVIEDVCDVWVGYKPQLSDVRIPPIITLEEEKVNTLPLTENKLTGYILYQKKSKKKKL